MADFAAWYPQLKAAHIALVMASGLLFALRGALVLYIVLGSLALKRARSGGGRLASYLGALGVYLFMVSVALAHQPLGLLQGWMARGA